MATTEKRNKYKIDFAGKTVWITKEFADNANDPASQEYELLKKLRQDFPTFTIQRRTHRTPRKYTAKDGTKSSCNPNKNLSYEHMELFMSSLPDGDRYLEPYAFLRYKAGKVQTSTYKAVRDWFVAQFPLYRSNPMFYLNNQVEPITDLSPFLQEEDKAPAQDAVNH